MWNEHCCPALYTLSLKFRPVFYKHVAADDKHHVSSYHVPIPALLSMLGVQLHSLTSLFPLWTRSLGVLFCNLPIKWHVMMWRGNTWQKGSSNYKMGLGSWGQRGLPGSSAGKKKNLPAMQETPVQFLDQEIPWRRDRLPTPVFLGFPGGSAGKESACNAGDLGSIPGWGRPPEEGNDYSLQYSGLEKSTDCIVHGVANSQTGMAPNDILINVSAKTLFMLTSVLFSKEGGSAPEM